VINPYTILTPAILQAMLKQPMYFVRQEYPRGADPGLLAGIPVLLTHYIHHDTDLERARRHLRLLVKDRYRFLYDTTDPLHLEKLNRAALQPEGFRIYVNLLPKKWKPSGILKKKVAAYMLHCLPGWKYSPSDKLSVTLKERYGELFLALLWKGQQTEVHLDLVENFSLCATT
jgi:hypothetical protein